jgi:hypothetical protein
VVIIDLDVSGGANLDPLRHLGSLGVNLDAVSSQPLEPTIVCYRIGYNN